MSSKENGNSVDELDFEEALRLAREDYQASIEKIAREHLDAPTLEEAHEFIAEDLNGLWMSRGLLPRQYRPARDPVTVLIALESLDEEFIQYFSEGWGPICYGIVRDDVTAALTKMWGTRHEEQQTTKDGPTESGPDHSTRIRNEYNRLVGAIVQEIAEELVSGTPFGLDDVCSLVQEHMSGWPSGPQLAVASDNANNGWYPAPLVDSGENGEIYWEGVESLDTLFEGIVLGDLREKVPSLTQLPVFSPDPGVAFHNSPMPDDQPIVHDSSDPTPDNQPIVRVPADLILEELDSLSAPPKLRKWAWDKRSSTLEELWLSLPRADWLMWLAVRIGESDRNGWPDRRRVIAVLSDPLGEMLEVVPEEESRPRNALDAIRGWVRNESTVEEVRKAVAETRNCYRDPREQAWALLALAIANVGDMVWEADRPIAGVASLASNAVMQIQLVVARQAGIEGSGAQHIDRDLVDYLRRELRPVVSD